MSQGVLCYDRNLQKHKYLNRDEYPVTSKVNYIPEDLLPVTVTSRSLHFPFTLHLFSFGLQ